MAMENSDFNRIMGKIQEVKDDLIALQNRTSDGFAFVQSVSYEELDEISNRLDLLSREAFSFFELNSERYKMMENDILLLQEEVTHARTSKDCTSNR